MIRTGNLTRQDTTAEHDTWDGSAFMAMAGRFFEVAGRLPRAGLLPRYEYFIPPLLLLILLLCLLRAPLLLVLVLFANVLLFLLALLFSRIIAGLIAL